tara:strand:+ start:1231 stop:1443 length:213 start_codon:yes stop_codon:yes gene_type:complete
LGNQNLKNYAKYVKKYCDCGIDYLSKKKPNEITENDEIAALGFCQGYLNGEKAIDAMEKDLRKNMRSMGY